LTQVPLEMRPFASPFCRALCSECGHVVARSKPVGHNPTFRTLLEQNTK
jgi:hypothetical protein